MKDQIPNLQMMEERKNRVKNRTPFQEWLQLKNESERKIYLEQNFIPDNGSFELKDFDSFFEERKILIKIKLIKCLGEYNGKLVYE